MSRPMLTLPAERTEVYTRRFWSRVERSGPTQPHMDTPCWIWRGYIAENGYGRVWYPGARTTWAHRVAYLLEREPPGGLSVLHRCDTPACVRPDHLFLGTHQENMADAVRKGRTARGDRTGPRLHPERMCRGEARQDAKLTAQAVSDMRSAFTAGASLRGLAERHGVAMETAWGAIRGRTWSHVTEPPPCGPRSRP